MGAKLPPYDMSKQESTPQPTVKPLTPKLAIETVTINNKSKSKMTNQQSGDILPTPVFPLFKQETDLTSGYESSPKRLPATLNKKTAANKSHREHMN